MSNLTTVPESRIRTLEPVDAAIMQVFWRHDGKLSTEKLPRSLWMELDTLGLGGVTITEVQIRLEALRNVGRIKFEDDEFRIDPLWPSHYAADTLDQIRKWQVVRGRGYVVPAPHLRELRRRIAEIMWACYVSLDQLAHDPQRGYEALLESSGLHGRARYETACMSVEETMSSNKGPLYAGPIIDLSRLGSSIRAFREVISAIELVASPVASDPGSLVPWSDDPDFVAAKDICDLPKFRGKLRQSNLSKKLRPRGPVRYMRRDTGSPKCKVHLADALNNGKYLLGSADQTDSIIDDVVDDVERHKAEILRTNNPNFDDTE